MRYMISGGGTGGHIYPAIAIFDELKKRDPDGEFLYVGTKTGPEKELASRAGYDYKSVRVKGLPRKKKSIKTIQTMFVLLEGLEDAKKIIRQFKPDIVIGTGGYVSFPVLYVAQNKKIKTLVQEQNAFPGKANRMLAKRADGVAIAFEDAKKRLETDKCFVSGNPIREKFETLDREEERKKLGLSSDEKLILSFGGSGGQESINDAIAEIIDAGIEKYKLIHITGREYYEEFMNAFKNKNSKNAKILEYSHEIPNLLAACDLAILSSSAISLAEVAASGVPSILIPKAYTADNHQEYNARAFESAGASLVILENELNSKILSEKIEEIISDDEKAKKMGEAAKRLSKPDATKTIVDYILSIIK